MTLSPLVPLDCCKVNVWFTFGSSVDVSLYGDDAGAAGGPALH